MNTESEEPNSGMSVAAAAEFLGLDAGYLATVPTEVVEKIAEKACNADKQFRTESRCNEPSVGTNSDVSGKTSQHYNSSMESSADGHECSQNGASELLCLRNELELARHEKRVLLESISRRDTIVQQLQEEVSDRTSKMLAQRSSTQHLNEQLLAAEAKLASVRSEDLAHSAEVQRLSAYTKWLSNELKNVQTESENRVHVLREQRIKLNREFDNLKLETEGLKQSHDHLKGLYTALSKRHDSVLVEVDLLKREKASAEDQLQIEVSTQKEITHLLEIRVSEYEVQIQKLEEELMLTQEEFNSQKKDAEATLAAEKEETRRLRQKLDSAEEKLQAVFDNSNVSNTSLPMFNTTTRASFSVSCSTPTRQQHRLSDSTSMVGALSPSAHIMKEMQRRGGSVVDLLTRYNAVVLERDQWKGKFEHLEQEMKQILDELERNGGEVLKVYADNEKRAQDLLALSKQNEMLRSEAVKHENNYRVAQQRLTDLENERTLSNKHIRDLSLQLQYLLINTQLRDNNQPALTLSQKSALEKVLNKDSGDEETDADRAISENLVLFRSIAELKSRNNQLLNVCRELTTRMEQEEKAKRNQITEDSNAVVMEAKKALDALQSELKSTRNHLEDVKKERDMFRSIIEDKSEEQNNRSGYTSSIEEIQRLKYELAAAERSCAEAKRVIDGRDKTVSELQNTLQTTRSELASVQARLELMTQRHIDAEDKIKQSELDAHRLAMQLGAAKESAASNEERAIRAESEIDDSKLRLQQLQSELNVSQANSGRLESICADLRQQNQEAVTAVAKLKKLLENSIAERDSLRDLAGSSESKLLAQIDMLKADVASFQELAAGTHERVDASTTEKMKALNDQVENLTKELEVSRQEIDALKQKLDRPQTPQQRNAESRANNVSSNNDNPTKAEVARLRLMLSNAQKISENAQKQVSKIMKERDTIELQVQELQKDNCSLSAKIEILEARTSATTTNVEGPVDDMSEAREFDETQLGLLQNDLRKLQQLADERGQRISDLEKELDGYRTSLEALEHRLEGEKAAWIAKENENKTLRDQVNDLSIRCDNLLAQIESSIAPNDDLNLRPGESESANALRQQLSDVSNQRDILKAKVDTLQADIERLNLKLEHLNSPNVNPEEKVKDQITLNLEEQLISIRKHAEELEAARDAAMQELKDIREKYAFSQESVKALETAKDESAQALADQAAEINDLKTQIALKGQSSDESLATSIKDSQNNDTATLLQKQIRSLELTIQNLNSSLKEREARIVFLENEVNRVSDELVESQLLHAQNDPLNGNTGQDLEHLRQESANLKSEVEKSEARAREAEQKLNELESRMVANESAMSIPEDGQVESLKRELSQLKSELDSMNDVAKTLSENTANAQITLTDDIRAKYQDKLSSEELESLQQHIEAATRQKLMIKARDALRRKLHEEQEAYQKSLDKLKKDLDDARAALNAQKDDEKSIEERIAKKFRAKMNLLQGRVTKLTSINEDLSNAVRQLKGGVDVNVAMTATGVLTCLDNKTQRNASENDSQRSRHEDDPNRPSKRPGDGPANLFRSKRR